MTGPTPGELTRDQHLYARLKRLITPAEKSALFAQCHDYPAYQAELLRLACRYRKMVKVPKD